MKKQETVDEKFTKVVRAWEESRQQKLHNIEVAQAALQVKYSRLQQEWKRLESEKERLKNLEPPKAPDSQVRSSQREASLKKLQLEKSSSKTV